MPTMHVCQCLNIGSIDELKILYPRNALIYINLLYISGYPYFLDNFLDIDETCGGTPVTVHFSIFLVDSLAHLMK